MSEPDTEQKARDLGWSPKEEFRGDPDRWIDAETFVERGETLMPLLKANNKKLSGDLNGIREELAKTQTLLKASAESIEALKDFNSAAVRKEAKEKKGELVEAIKEARQDNNVERELELVEQLEEHDEALKAAERKPVEKPAPVADFTQDPDWKAWMEENGDWFGKDRRRTALSMGIADELRADPAMSHLHGKAFLDRVTEETNRTLNINQPSRTDKVEGGARPNGSGSNGSGRGGKSFSDLPIEARTACDKQAARLVGEGRAFKTKAEWQSHYAKKYFEE